MDGQRACASPRPQPVADEFIAEPERTAGAALLGRPLALGDERAVGDADGRELEHRAELEREACSARRMVAPGRVDQKHVRQLWQGANGGFKECALAEGEQARLVRRACTACQHRRAPADARGCPRPVADLAGAAFPAGEADEDAADLHVRRAPPRCRSERGQPRLLLDQLLARERPLEHGRILATDARVAAAHAAGEESASRRRSRPCCARWPTGTSKPLVGDGVRARSPTAAPPPLGVCEQLARVHRRA